MPESRRTWRIWLLVMVLVIAGTVLIAAGAVAWIGETMFAAQTQSEQRLLYRVNHQEVSDACELLRKHVAATRPVIIGIESKAAHDLPAALQQLGYEDIVVEPERVVIYFGGGFGHWGFVATDRQPREGLKQLTSRLWYWNEWHRLPPDPSKAPLVRKSFTLMASGLVAFALAMTVFVRSSRKGDQ